MADIFWGDSLIKPAATGGDGELVNRNGERFYKITNFHQMPAFFISLVSGSDHWMFLSSTGGLTCGRKSPEYALFPYYTDDKIHDAGSTTGPQTVFLVEKEDRTSLWKPFSRDVNVYQVERNLYKNKTGSKLIFEEVNSDLDLVFSYGWSSSDRFGFVKTSRIRNTGSDEIQIRVLDGLRNVLPYGVDRTLQTGMSTLLDAYKQAEAVPGMSAGIYTLSSIPSDRAEPSEALKATVIWGMGLDEPCVLLSQDQVAAFCDGTTVKAETSKKGKRGAFFLQSSFKLLPQAEKCWYMLADINQGPSEVATLLENVRQGVPPEAVEQDIEYGTLRLKQLVGSADGYQLSSDEQTASRHFSNTLFNIMRGGTFYSAYAFPPEDLLDFTGSWNRPLREKFTKLLATLDAPPTRASVLAAVERTGDADMERLALEYLPLIFSRRHGDPSRPWNHFSIDIRNPDGTDRLYYQGNWRDIFQNWEALAVSYPEYIESFIAKFVNASTADGYNPYRITRDGFDWEVLNPQDPWSNIGYWGDHQVSYLVKLLELSRKYHPDKIDNLLAKEIFVYADVPYRLKGYAELLDDPRNSVVYDDFRAKTIAERVRKIGSDGKLAQLPDGTICKAGLLEKLLVPILVKIGNFVPGGGIWLNTQRPEWNDANNALVGYGLSMVTLYYLRRFLVLIAELLDENNANQFMISREVLRFFAGIDVVLKNNKAKLSAPFSSRDRKIFMNDLGLLNEGFRESVYAGWSGEKSAIEVPQLSAFIDLALQFLDQTIAQNRRADGLFHSYNLIHFADDGYRVENLYEMLEGQVAILSSGYLGPQDSLALLDAMKSSKMYRSDQNSYMLYPYRKLPSFLEKNVIKQSIVDANALIRRELSAGRNDFVEQDLHGVVHFNGNFRNVGELRAALCKDPEISTEDVNELCNVYEAVFRHRQFTGRSGAMYKYEGLGCIYWHMVSKLLLATGELITLARQSGAQGEVLTSLLARFDDIQDGLGVHKEPAVYGAFPVDPYSHTPAFAGVQQPGMTGQVKEDVITRFLELGVTIDQGEISFDPVILKRDEFISRPRTWHYSLGGQIQSEDVEAGSLAFSLCGVPVIYRLSESSAIQVFTGDHEPESIQGCQLGQYWSQSLFLREQRVRKIIVDIPQALLR